MSTRKYLHVKENRKDIPIMPPDLVPLTTLIGSNYTSRTIFYGPKSVRAIEVLLYLAIKQALFVSRITSNI